MTNTEICIQGKLMFLVLYFDKPLGGFSLVKCYQVMVQGQFSFSWIH